MGIEVAEAGISETLSGINGYMIDISDIFTETNLLTYLQIMGFQ